MLPNTFDHFLSICSLFSITPHAARHLTNCSLWYLIIDISQIFGPTQSIELKILNRTIIPVDIQKYFAIIRNKFITLFNKNLRKIFFCFSYYQIFNALTTNHYVSKGDMQIGANLLLQEIIQKDMNGKWYFVFKPFLFRNENISTCTRQ